MIKFRKSNCRGFWGQYPTGWFQECGKCKSKVSEKHLLFDAEADDNDVDTDAAVFSVGGGMKYFMSNDVALTVDGSYQSATDDIFVDSEDGDRNKHKWIVVFTLPFAQTT